MKIFIFAGLVILSWNTIFSQDLKPSEFEALIMLEVTTLGDTAIDNKTVIFQSEVEKKEVSVRTNEKGIAQVLLPKGKAYHVKYKDLLETVNYSTFEIPSDPGQYIFDVIIKFQPSKTVTLQEISFADDGKLIKSSTKELVLMKEVLESQPELNILVAAHSDNSKSVEEAMSYTEKQASVIKEYLLSLGISGDRIEAKGFGSQQPKFPNLFPEGRLKNNRVEIRVSKK